MSTREGRIHARAAAGPDGGGRLEEHLEPVEGERGPAGRAVHEARHGPREDGRSIVELLKELSGDSGTLVRQEVELAKAEMREKLDVFQKSMISMAIGGAFLLAALLTGLWAVNQGLTALLAQFTSLELAVWLAPLLLTVVLGAIGWGIAKGAKEEMASEGIKPQQSTDSLREDRRWAREKVQEVKEEMTHGR